MRISALCSILLLGALLPAAGLAAEDRRPPALTGTYSDVCVHPESGDLLGTELSFTRSGDVTYVLMQIYEGEAVPPELLTVTYRGAQMYVTAEGGGDVLALELKETALYLRWLGGRLGSSGSERDVLQHGVAVWAGGEPAYCGARGRSSASG